ncbi:Asp-tRNA(Asn)/Glu-tRNA(Gln) amidotransferase subunit GatC [Patescibacteria group bacterium]|nr:Asp-tRNA(Asn)/Glu-tRNA(Gln) amidotransferase subunit GatC [Patescibacteria group bacterium]
MSSKTITANEVKRVAKLARINIPPEKIDQFTSQLEPILENFASLSKVNTDDVVPTYQTTGLNTVLREDVVDKDRMFTQKQALSNAPQSSNGYFVTSATIKK